jgi:hypothetical protein
MLKKISFDKYEKLRQKRLQQKKIYSSGNQAKNH